jgi:modulator of FtsH protease
MIPAYTPSLWSTFFSAQVSASAALTGLLFVAVSINLERIVAARLLARASKVLVTLACVLVAATLSLVPQQPLWALGAELTTLGGILWVVATGLQRAASQEGPHVTARQRVLQSVLTQLSAIPFASAGVSLLFVWGGGLYWLVAGTVFALIAALADAWVLLTGMRG